MLRDADGIGERHTLRVEVSADAVDNHGLYQAIAVDGETPPVTPGNITRSTFTLGECCPANIMPPAAANNAEMMARLRAQPSPGQRQCPFMRPPSVVLHTPPRILGQLDPCIAHDWWRPATSAADVEFSIIVNVFNHEATITRVVTQILKLTTEPFELILFFDGCSDDSFAKVHDAASYICITSTSQSEYIHNSVHLLQVLNCVPVCPYYATNDNNILPSTASSCLCAVAVTDQTVQLSWWDICTGVCGGGSVCKGMASV